MAVLLPRIFIDRGFKRKLLLQSWICCILLTLLTLPSAFSSCNSVFLSLYPGDEVFIRYGEPLELFCLTWFDNSKYIEFTKSGKLLKSEMVNSTSLRLYSSMPERQSETYYCRNRLKNKMCLTRVVVDSPPANVTDFSCLSNNFETLNCSWTVPMSFSVPTYNVSLAVNNNLINPESCVAAPVGATPTRYCVWNTTVEPQYRQVEELVFYMNACNAIGCNDQNFTMDRCSVVKPDRVYDLKLISRSPRDVLLRWKVPNNMYEFCNCRVEHIIEYQIARVDNTTYYRSVYTQLSLRNSTYTFNLYVPYANQQYEFRVYIKTEKAINRMYWSDYQYLVFSTPSDIPNKPPEMIAGAFHRINNNGNRYIKVYWKQLELYEEAGPNFTYKVLISQGNDSTQILFPDKNKSMNFVRLDGTSEGLDVRVWSCNVNGTSVNSSHLYIPSEKDTIAGTSFRKVHYNITYELSWFGVNNIDNYTLFWCQPSPTLQLVCADRLDFTVLDSSTTSYSIYLPDNKYRFAISANKGSKSSGMVWSSVASSILQNNVTEIK